MCGNHAVFAQKSQLSAGLIFGEPVGIIVKQHLNKTEAIQGILGYSVTRRNSQACIYFDYLWHNYNAVNSKEYLPLYYGVGLRYLFLSQAKDNIGLHTLIGIIWVPKKFPMEFFVETGPLIVAYPSFGFDFGAGAGLRFPIK